MDEEKFVLAMRNSVEENAEKKHPKRYRELHHHVEAAVDRCSGMLLLFELA